MSKTPLYKNIIIASILGFGLFLPVQSAWAGKSNGNIHSQIYHINMKIVDIRKDIKTYEDCIEQLRKNQEDLREALENPDDKNIDRICAKIKLELYGREIMNCNEKINSFEQEMGKIKSDKFDLLKKIYPN